MNTWQLMFNMPHLPLTMANTAATRMRALLGDAYVNNAGQIRWIDGVEGENLPGPFRRGVWYHELGHTDDDYNFTNIEDMVETMDLCCWKIGTPDDQTGYVEVLVGEYDFFLNLQTNQLLTRDKQYIVGEKNDAVPIYERQCRVNLWIGDDWESLW